MSTKRQHSLKLQAIQKEAWISLLFDHEAAEPFQSTKDSLGLGPAAPGHSDLKYPKQLKLLKHRLAVTASRHLDRCIIKTSPF